MAEVMNKVQSFPLYTYFKRKTETDPDTVLEIMNYHKQTGELPFTLENPKDLIYNICVERQKVYGVENGQFVTHPEIAQRIGVLTQSFSPPTDNVLNACCGIGMIAKALENEKWNVEGFDIDPNVVEVCSRTIKKGQFFVADYENWNINKKWDLVISYPPIHKENEYKFFKWLREALTPKGYAILLLNKSFFKDEHKKITNSILESFQVTHIEDISSELLENLPQLAIHVFEFSDYYRSILIPESEKVLPFDMKEEEKKELAKNEIPKTEEKVKPVEKLTLPVDTANNKFPEPMTDASSQIMNVPLDRIRPNPDNPRTTALKEEELERLANSIKLHGVIQPIMVNDMEEYYEIIFGECRYLASIKAGKSDIPAIVTKLDKTKGKEQSLQLALIENLHRKDITPLEEAHGFAKFREMCGGHIYEVATRVGRSESYIRTRLALLLLIDELKELLQKDLLSLGKAQLLGKYSGNTQRFIYKNCLGDDINSWLHIGINEFEKRLEEQFSPILDQYGFDKTSCLSCNYNTSHNELFPENSQSKCTNIECLNKKKNEYLNGVLKKIKEKKKEVEICVSPETSLSKQLKVDIKNAKITVLDHAPTEIPVKPCEPKREHFANEKDYENANYQFMAENNEYEEEVYRIKQDLRDGRLKEGYYINNNNPRPCYIPIINDEVTETVEMLQDRLKKAHQAMISNIGKEVVSHLKENHFKDHALNELEEKLLVYFMLSYLRTLNYQEVGHYGNGKITDQIRDEIFPSLNDRHYNTIRRDFIFHHLKNAKGICQQTEYLFDLMKLHYPKEYKNLRGIYKNQYMQEKQEIETKIAQLQKNEEKKPRNKKVVTT